MSVESPTFFEKIPSWTVRFAKDQMIFGEGDAATHAYRVERGCVRLQLDTLNGDRHIVGFVLPGEVFGLGVGERRVSAEAVGPVQLSCCSNRAVLDLIETCPEAAQEVLREIDLAVRRLAGHTAMLRSETAAERVLTFCRDLGAAARRPPMTHRDIADHLRLRPETLSRTLRQLCAAGRLVRDSGRGFVLCEAVDLAA